MHFPNCMAFSLGECKIVIVHILATIEQYKKNNHVIMHKYLRAP